MRFGELRIRNFLSFGDEPQVFNLDNRGVVLIDGKNGHGKSTIPEALLWCLYGITVRGYRDDQVIHRWGEKKNCEVQQTFWTDAGQPWCVVRARRSAVFASRLHLFQSEWRADLKPGCAEDVSSGGQDETQEKIDVLLGMSRMTARSTIVFGQSNSYRFTQLTDGQQKDILDEALGTQLYKQAGKAAAEEADAVEAQRDVLLVEQDARERSIARETDRIAELKVLQQRFAEERERSGLATAAALKAARSQYSEAKLLADRWPASSALAKRLEAEATNIDNQWQELSRKAFRYQARTAECLRQVQDLRATAERFYCEHTAECGECGQVITEEAVDKRVRSLLAEARPLYREARAEEQLNQRAQRRVASLRRAAQQVLKHLQEARDEAAVAKSAVEALPRHLRAIKDAEARCGAPQDDAYPARIGAAERELVKLKIEHQLAEQEVQRLTKRLQECKFWVVAYSAKGLRSLLLDSEVPTLNAEAAKCSAVLTSGEVTVEFRTQRALKDGRLVDDFHVAIENAEGAADYIGDSGGERAKADLVVALALQKLVASRATAKMPIAFFDEPFDALDDDAVECVATFLTEELRSRSSVFVISHSSALKAFFSESVTVVKRGKVSTVE